MLLTPLRTDVCVWFTEAWMLLSVTQSQKCLFVLSLCVCVFLPPLSLPRALLTKLNGQCISLFRFSLFQLCAFT